MGFPGDQKGVTTAQDLEVERIRNLLLSPKALSVDDFNNKAYETWKYVLDIANYRWVFPGSGYEEVQMINSQLVQDLL